MRIYVDESGTHADEWLVIGMLFVPNHGPFHAQLCKIKEDLGYFNRSPNRRARYKESTLKSFKSRHDVDVAKGWFDAFVASDCFFRAIVIDWSIWDGSYFGDPFEADALKRRRAYKKWAEQILQPEFSTPLPGRAPIRGATFHLDKLRVVYGYDLLDHLEERFKPPDHYIGARPYIGSYQHVTSWRDANQCLQLCDLLVGSIYQSLVPAKSEHKLAARDALARRLKPLGVDRFEPGFWKQYHHISLRQKHPRFSAWHWQPEAKRVGAKPKSRGTKRGRTR